MTIGSYSHTDVTFLLTEIKDQVKEIDTEEREVLIQSGTPYYEMLPKEYEPSQKYIKLFEKLLHKHAKDVAILTSSTSEKIKRYYKKGPVLISLARAGTPIGILIKRYIQYRYYENWPHYSISIIRNKGIDENALNYLCTRYNPDTFLFVDGWTGKGTITKELREACYKYMGVIIKPILAVLCDPGHSANFSGSFEDKLIPNACLNATVSGLISRTFYKKSIIGSDQFHGVKCYNNKKDLDYSNIFISTVSSHFKNVNPVIDYEFIKNPDFSGMDSAIEIQKKFNIDSIHKIKPGIGETTRVLLRRLPWKILYKPNAEICLEHIFQLAQEKHIPLEPYLRMPYNCCGLIKGV
jgi:hypothetical protein